MIANRYLEIIKEELRDQVDEKKFDNFLEVVQSGHKFSTKELNEMGSNFKQAYIKHSLVMDSEVQEHLAKGLT